MGRLPIGFALNSIRRKFIFFVSLSIVIVMLIYSVANIYVSDKANHTSLQAHINYITHLSAESLAIPLSNNDGDAIRGIGRALHNDIGIVYINIIEYRNDRSVYQSNNLPEEDITIFGEREIIYRNEDIGHLTIGFDTTPLRDEFYGLIFQSLLQTLFLIALLTFVIGWISRFITRPLEQLKRVTSDFADGDLDARADIRSNDEVEILAKEFNHMADSLEQQIEETEYLSTHDPLTGLYNRHHFDVEFQRYNDSSLRPFTIMIADLNGLKMANDVYGHEFGDQLLIAFSDILKECCEDKGTPVRWGGDEFIILLPNTNRVQAAIIRKELKNKCEAASFDEAGFAKLSVAVGHGTRLQEHEGLMDVIKNAEDIMYREKLLESKSVHSSIMDYLKSTLNERSKETFEHAERLWEYSLMIAEELDISSDDLNKLKLFSSLHDLGKIAISDSILMKEGPLTNEEWVEMRKHSEIGYRLALTSPELVSIADLILSHHERWDGSGYPQGLYGDEIPLLARILSIADAYDAMTEDRPYRKKMSHLEALSEIRGSSRKQFDPKLAEIFITKMSMTEE